MHDDWVTLEEFAIHYPLPETEENLSGVSVIERFTPKAVGLSILQEF
jgi:hypothetical protein